MFRTRIVLAGCAAALVLAGCGGQGDATQDKVRDRVESILIEDGLVTADGQQVDFTEAEALDMATCVATSMFGSDAFTREERNRVARSADGSEPDPELVAQVQALVDDCVADAGTAGPDLPADDSDEE